MEITIIYAIAISAIFGILCIIRAFCIAQSLCRNRLLSFVLRHLIYPALAGRIPILNSLTPVRAALLALYLAGTGICNAWGITTSTQASIRAGWLSVANMIPLFMTGRLCTAMDIFGLSLEHVRMAHGTLGFMAISQTAAHIGIELKKMPLRISQRVDFYGLLAASGLCAILVSIIFRHRAYQFFARSHLLLTLFTAVCIWCHPHSDIMQSKPYLIAAVAAYATFIVVQLCSVLATNMFLRRRCARAFLITKGDGIQVDLKLAGPMQIRPGQFINIWMPGLSFFSMFQTHPYMVMWQQPEKYRLPDGQERPEKRFTSLSEEVKQLSQTSSILLQSSRGLGPSMKFMARSDHKLLAWIDGPYGSPPNYGQYDQVIFMASGIGIAAHMLAIKHLIEAREEQSIITKTISLHWKVDDSLNAEWVRDHFNYLLLLDAERTALDIDLYVPHGSSDYSAKRIQVLDDTHDMAGRIKAELDCAKGNVLVSVSGCSHMRRNARDLCTRRYYNHPIVRYHQSDFQIENQQSWWTYLRKINSR